MIIAMKTVKQLREEFALSQEEVIKQIGITISTYSRIENRKQKPRPETRRNIAKLFGVKPADIDW